MAGAWLRAPTLDVGSEVEAAIFLRHPAQAARQAIGILDGYLRRAQGVIEFTTRHDCVLRMAKIRAGRFLRLVDGTVVDRGDTILELHLWNEHLPMRSSEELGCQSAAELFRRVQDSLSELARRMSDDADLRPIKAVSARTACSSGGRRREMASVAARLGFEVIEEEPGGVGHAIHDYAENFWLWGLAWAFNPLSLRGQCLIRHRQRLWISSARLRRLYQTAPAPAKAPE